MFGEYGCQNKTHAQPFIKRFSRTEQWQKFLWTLIVIPFVLKINQSIKFFMAIVYYGTGIFTFGIWTLNNSASLLSETALNQVFIERDSLFLLEGSGWFSFSAFPFNFTTWWAHDEVCCAYKHWCGPKWHLYCIV